MQLKSFRHKGLERLWRTGDSRGVSAKWAEKIRAMLTALEEADAVAQVGRFPGWKLHPLKGARSGTWAMWITGNMRLTFHVREKAVTEIDIEDYH
jgi:proteic killer suppression protein